MVNRIVVGVVVVAALGAAFVLDRSAVAKRAREQAILQCGQEYNLSVTAAELQALRAQIAVGNEANNHLQEKIQVADGERLRAILDLEAYERETENSHDGIVDADLFGRLRAN
ncbi:hypothetical protein RKLH11_1568 [Rhodobacteraceae bacterium KLH11]|nr:hypothetical protein RKLH11_1568 [Rhodobacteraceae bacterium KLH11]